MQNSFLFPIATCEKDETYMKPLELRMKIFLSMYILPKSFTKILNCMWAIIKKEATIGRFLITAFQAPLLY